MANDWKITSLGEAAERYEQMTEAEGLDAAIRQNLEGLGYGE